jgi:hypothetical protein
LVVLPSVILCEIDDCVWSFSFSFPDVAQPANKAAMAIPPIKPLIFILALLKLPYYGQCD